MSSFPALGGLRGICSLIIVTGHFFTFFAPQHESKFPTATVDYLPPVSIFFILSGFLLGVLYQDRLGEWQQRKDFWIKRFARIAPMYYFSLLVALPILIAYEHSHLLNLISSLVLTPLFLQSLTLIGASWNSPLWQTSTLMLCYLIYPYFLKFIRHRNPWLWGIICYLFSLILFILTMLIQQPAIAHLWFVARAPHFFIGVTMGIHYNKQPDTTTIPLLNSDTEMDSPKPRGTMKDIVLLELLTLVLLAVFLFCLILGFTSVGDKYWFAFQFSEEFIMIPIYCLWITYLCKATGGITYSFFTSWVMEKLGDLSYSIYVLHFPFFFLFSWLKSQKITDMRKVDENDTDISGPFVLDNYELLSCLGIIICTSVLTFHYIENPARDWIIKKFCAQRKPTTPK